MVLFHKYIQELLFQYDCVVIPNFGGFVCSFSPAKIHPVQHRFHPPGKHISFNKMLVMNDGLLAHHIALSTGLTYNEAIVLIENQVKSWKESLRIGQPIELEGIGKFFNDLSGNLQFQFDSELNFLVQSYGLTSFQYLPIIRERKLEVVRDIQETNEDTESININRLAKYSVAAALISIVALATFKIQSVSDFHFDKISVFPLGNEKVIYQPIEYKSIYNNDSEINRSWNEKIAGSESYIVYDAEIDGVSKGIVIELEEKEKIEKVENTEIRTGKYHVVGGCFGVKANAQKMVLKLQRQGYKADMSVEHKGLIVVSYQSFNDDSDARSFLEKVKREHNNQAWLLVK